MASLYKSLSEEKHKFILSQQVLGSRTSMGANVKEALQAESRVDFIHKLSLALKEASETESWLPLLKDAEFMEQHAFDSLNADCVAWLKLLTSMIKTSKQNLT
jgi:four helix bundle protein